MADEPAGDTGTVTEEAPGFDIEAASDKIGEALFPPQASTETEEPETEVAETPTEGTATLDHAAPMAEVPVPKSWKQEMHQHWGKIPREVQDYWQVREKQMLDGIEQYKTAASYGKSVGDVLAPYQPLLQSKGLDAPRVVADLMQTYTALTQGTPEQRWTAYQQLAKNLGLSAPAEGATPVDPHVKQLQDQFNQMQQALTAQHQEALQAARAKATQEVEAFAADTAHGYFEELQDDILGFLKLGDSLQGAYEKAVWANPVTRAKEIARTQTETEAKLKENARLQALPKKQAKSVNIGGREVQRAPTEPLGKMEDTLKTTLAGIRSRVAH